MENEEKEIKEAGETPAEKVEESAKAIEEDKAEPEETKPVEEESDFADEVKQEEPLPEVVEEPEPEEVINLYSEKEEESVQEEQTEEVPTSEPSGKGKKAEIKYDYKSEDLASIEAARKTFHKSYKKLNIIKWIITAVGLVLIVVGWVVPSTINGIASNVTMYISLGVTAVVLIVLGVYSVIFRKKVDKSMKEYFKTFYDYTNKYVFPPEVESLNGTVDDKLPQELFLESNIYKDVVKVGSRAYMTFNYKGLKCHIADAAAQKKGDRQLETLFVGKFLKIEDVTNQDELLVYLKGNKRALPPNSLKGRNLIEDSKTMVIYGSGKARSLLTKKVREAIAQFDTNRIFIDMSITVNEKGLFIAMGYEDDLMVLPLEKPFNPAPTDQYKEDFEKVLNLIDAFTSKHDNQ